MKISGLAFAAALALSSGAACAAGGPLDLSSGSAGFSSTPVAGGFTELFTFTLSTASFAAASITSVVNGAQDIDFSFIALTGPSGVFSFTQLLGDPVETWALSSSLLAPGAYTLSVVGTNSAAIASYGGNLAVSAVPEPDRYALLLAGLIGIGYIASRRRG